MDLQNLMISLHGGKDPSLLWALPVIPAPVCYGPCQLSLRLPDAQGPKPPVDGQDLAALDGLHLNRARMAVPT